MNTFAFFCSSTQPCCSAKWAMPMAFVGSSWRSRKAQQASITFGTWNMVAAGSSWHTVTSVTRIWPVYMKYRMRDMAVGQT